MTVQEEVHNNRKEGEVRAQKEKRRCEFCKKELSREEKTESHGYCHECFWLRRILKRARTNRNQVGLSESYERELWSALCELRVPQKYT